MRSAEKFKIGFLKQAAEMGVTPADFEKALTKVSWWNPLKDIGKATVDLGWKGLGAGLAVSGAAGTALGVGSRLASQADDEDMDEVKMQETAKLYRQLARDIRRRINVRQQEIH